VTAEGGWEPLDWCMPPGMCCGVYHKAWVVVFVCLQQHLQQQHREGLLSCIPPPPAWLLLQGSSKCRWECAVCRGLWAVGQHVCLLSASCTVQHTDRYFCRVLLRVIPNCMS
jgi:hypothetical protein